MCIIFHNPDGRPINRNHLQTAYENNPHGYGFMWNEGGHLNIVKGVAKDFNEIRYLSQELKGFEYTLHLRWRTAGIIGEQQCHPFQILEKDNDGLDFSMVHNGTMFQLTKHPEKSDTQLFSENLRRIILAKDPRFKLNFISGIEKKVGKHNKMVFMTSDKRTFFVNKQLGTEINGVWYSNTYSIEGGYRDKVAFEPGSVFNSNNDTIKVTKSKNAIVTEYKMNHEDYDLPRGFVRASNRGWVYKRNAMPKWSQSPSKSASGKKNNDL
jgi:predicted glutamine amidotransferase